MMNNNEHNDTNKSNPPPSQPSSNQKDPSTAETAKFEKNKIEDDKVEFGNIEHFSESIKSTKPGAVAVKEGDESKIKQKKEIIMIYNIPALTRHYPINEISGSNKEKDENQEIMEKEIAMDASEEETYPGFSHPGCFTSFNEEGLDLEQDRAIVNEGNDNYEMPNATKVNDSEVALALRHAEPIDLVEDIVVVDAKVIIHVSMQMNDYLFLNVVNIIHK